VTKPRRPATRKIVGPRPQQLPRPMRVPAPRELRHGRRWATIRYALDSNARTFRLCLILFVLIVSSGVATMIPLLVRHVMLCGPGWLSTGLRPGRGAPGGGTSPRHAGK
jgi:hypothetical protein